MKIHLYAVRLQRALRAEETETLMKLLPPERRARLERLVYLGDDRCIRKKYVKGRKIVG